MKKVITLALGLIMATNVAIPCFASEKSISLEKVGIQEAKNIDVEEMNVQEVENIDAEEVDIEKTESMDVEEMNIQEVENTDAEEVDIEETESMDVEEMNIQEVENTDAEEVDIEETESMDVEEMNIQEVENTDAEEVDIEETESMDVEEMNIQEVENTDEEETDIQEVESTDEEETESIDVEEVDTQMQELENMNKDIVFSGSETLWSENYKNVSSVYKNIRKTWALTATNMGYFQLYFENLGDTDVTINLLKDSPVGGQTSAHSPITIGAGKDKIVQIYPSDLEITASNNLQVGRLYVYCTNLDLEKFSVFCRCVYYN